MSSSCIYAEVLSPAGCASTAHMRAITFLKGQDPRHVYLAGAGEHLHYHHHHCLCGTLPICAKTGTGPPNPFRLTYLSAGRCTCI